MHEAPRVTTPEVLRVQRQRQDRSCDFLGNALLEQPLVCRECTKRVRFDLRSRLLPSYGVYRLERVRTRLADLRPDVIRYVELRFHLGVPPAPFVVGVSCAMSVVLAHDKERRFHDEPEITMFEWRTVSVPHQESDQPLVALAERL